MVELQSWGLLAALGAFHGVNPGMGWLFAVALGLQERRRRAVLNALVPLGLGHALAVTAAVAAAALAGAVLSATVVRAIVAAALLTFGGRRLLRHSHPAWARMRVGFARLTLWSFLMASAHGAGLMVVPIFLGMTGGGAEAPAEHAHHAAAATTTLSATVFATSLHAAGYLVVTGVVALVVFEKVGVGLLRKAWLNTDTMWAAALIGTGIGTLLI
jgi:hypothetical protein